jgi:hypothetical protein
VNASPLLVAGSAIFTAPVPEDVGRPPSWFTTAARPVGLPARLEARRHPLGSHRHRHRARATLARVLADITSKKHLNPGRRHRSYPRVIKRGRHNAYRVKKPGDHGPATIRLANPVTIQAA